MDNRWRFLYYVYPELWGRMWRARAGKEKTGTSGVGEGQQIFLTIRRRNVDRTKVGKRVSHVPRKAAIVIHIPVP